MSQLLLDAMNNAALWRTRQPDGVTASTALTITATGARFRFRAARTSLQLSGNTDANGHTAERDLANIDLRTFEELRLWLYSDRPADGSAQRPFYLEVQLGSSAVPVTDPGNTWRRFLPVTRANAWELQRFSLDDLPVAVRSSVNHLLLRCVDATVSFTCWLDDLLAVREEMIGDVDTALQGQLHEQVTINGSAVSAVLHNPEATTQPAPPYIRINHYRIQPVRERASYPQVRSDYNGTGYRLRSLETGCDLYYAIDVFAAERTAKTQLQEFILQRLAPAGELIVNGLPLPIEWISEPVSDYLFTGTERALLFFKVATRQLAPVSEAVITPYNEVAVETDQRRR